MISLPYFNSCVTALTPVGNDNVWQSELRYNCIFLYAHFRVVAMSKSVLI